MSLPATPKMCYISNIQDLRAAGTNRFSRLLEPADFLWRDKKGPRRCSGGGFHSVDRFNSAFNAFWSIWEKLTFAASAFAFSQEGIFRFFFTSLFS